MRSSEFVIKPSIIMLRRYSCEISSLDEMTSKQEVYMLIICIMCTILKYKTYLNDTVSYKSLYTTTRQVEPFRFILTTSLLRDRLLMSIYIIFKAYLPYL